ncbi:hypothetical protein AAVH_24104 [Aphelenchoides avenae]|nr:hypothetical protein AAVH_24104 [Aphelenchus avenae]
MTVKASDAKFDIREDEEQYVKLAETLDLLVSAGYYRAKIQGLSAFDKIVGGMVWCISLCAQSVDVDLLYSENSTIGQKIALTENIVKVLPSLKCPHAIEPHQIQGLDAIHIFPVWLVKEAILAKEQHGDEIQNHAVYQFQQQGWRVKSEDSRPKPAPKPRHATKPKPRRTFKRADGLQTGNIAEDVKCTLLEYGLDTEDVVVRKEYDEDDATKAKKREREAEAVRDLKIAERIKAELRGLDDGEQKQRVSARAVAKMVQTSELEQLASTMKAGLDLASAETAEDELSRLKRKLDQLTTEEHLLQAEAQEEERKYNAMRTEYEDLQQKISDYDNILASADSSVVNTIKELLAEHDENKRAETEYKRQCRQEIAGLDDEIERLQRLKESDGAEPSGGSDSYEVQQLTDQLKGMSQRIAEINRGIFHLERKVESQPSQIELNQYQRRFIELYNQMSSKHRETKRHYTLYNTLLDVRNFIQREIDLLNNIDDQKNLALKENYKDSFVENLQKICRSIEESLEKILNKKRELTQQKDDLADNLQVLQNKQRLYTKTLVDFQTECNKNVQLQAQLGKSEEVE